MGLKGIQAGVLRPECRGVWEKGKSECWNRDGGRQRFLSRLLISRKGERERPRGTTVWSKSREREKMRRKKEKKRKKQKNRDRKEGGRGVQVRREKDTGVPESGDLGEKN